MILLAPNTFRDCLTSFEVAREMEKGIRRVLPNANIISRPLADGGDNTLDVLAPLFNAEKKFVFVRDPLGRKIQARFLYSSKDALAIIEMATASGLSKVDVNERNPFASSSWGTGDLIISALDCGAKKILLGAGGSATIDGGAGALSALGVKFLDALGNELRPVPHQLLQLSFVDLGGIDRRLANIELLILADVDTPLLDNPRIFGPQKGVLPSEFRIYEEILLKFMSFSSKDSNICLRPWHGAGGGIAAGLVAFANAKVVSGSKYISMLLELDTYLNEADCFITGEGSLDQSSLHGKAPVFMAKAAIQKGVKSFIIAGKMNDNVKINLENITVLDLSKKNKCSKERSLKEAPYFIAAATEYIANFYLNSSSQKG